MNISAICQNNQTTIIENDWLRNAAKLIEKGKIDAARIVLLNQKIDSLQARITNLLLINQIHAEKDTAQKYIVASYENQIKNYQDEIAILTKASKKLDRKLRRQKTITIIAPILTAGLTAAGFIFLK